MDRTTYLAELAALHEAGTSQRELARHFGKSRSTIRRDLASLKPEAPRATPPAAPAPTGPEPDWRPSTLIRQVPLADRSLFTSRAALDAARDLLPLQGGRVTTSGGGPGAPTGLKGQTLTPPDQWRIEDIDPNDLRRLAPAELVARMIRISPEIGRARYDFLRLANPGWEWKALIPGGEEPHEQGQIALDLFVEELRRRHGSPQVVFNRLLDGFFLRGALFAELVLDSTARIALDIATPDPATAEFRVQDDPDLGQRWELVQKQGQDYVNVERPTVKYVPLDPQPDSPFGTPMVSPALFPAIFLLLMMQDARRVVAQQGWPRLDIIIDATNLIKLMPAADREQAAKVKAWVDDTIAQVATQYSTLDPDKAWVHTDAVAMGTPVGAIGNLQGLAPLVDILERMGVRALKTMPMMMGLPEGVSEANANRQWEMLTKGTESVQLLAEEPLSEFGTLVLEAQGIPAISKFTFLEMRSSEELRDAEALAKRLANAELAERLGFMSHDEASVYAVGHEPVAEATAEEEDTEIEDEPAEDDTPEGEEPVSDEPETPADEDAEDADRNARLMRTRAQVVIDVGPAIAALEQLKAQLGDAGHTQLSAGDLQALLFYAGRALEPGVPVEGLGDPALLPPVPASVQVDSSDMRLAEADWNYRMTGYRDLLDAEVDDEQPDE